MSYGTVKANTIENSNGQTGNAIGPGFKNRIINGAMMIDQRNAGASVTPANLDVTLDRWKAGLTQSSKFSVQQSTTAPSGFVNSLLITSLSAYSITATDIFNFQQRIEGLNVADLGWGTASAKTVTLSFWVRSSLTGTFGGSLANSAFDRSYPFTYTINSANTWEQKSITVAGDTTGTWLTTNGIGILTLFGLGVGSTYSGTAGAWAAAGYYSATGATSVVGTNGATFYITGVQLEVGPSATSFDYRPYGTELALCQRYYEKIGRSGDIYNLPVGYCYQSGGVNYLYWYGVPLLVEKRTTPTISFSSSGGTSFFHGIYGTSETASTLDATMTGNVTAVVQSARAVSFYQPTNSTTGANAGSALLAALKNGQYVFVSAEL